MKKGIDYIGVAVGALILNDKDEIFMAKRGQKAKNERGHWEAPGGGMDFGEDMRDAIRREIMEEYGADIEVLEQLPAANHIIPDEGQHWVSTCFIARFKEGEEPRIMEPEKCDEIGWFAADSLPEPLSIVTKINLAYWLR